MTTTSYDPAMERALLYSGPAHLNDIGYEPERSDERNALRAHWGACALKAYTNTVGYDTLSTSIQDLISDLLHLNASTPEDERGDGYLDELDLIDSAVRRFEEEQAGE